MKLYMFRTVPLSIIRSFTLYTQQWYTSYKFADSLQAGSGWNCSSILILLESCLQTCMTHTTAVCTVKNSWWWTEQLSEICRVSFQNKFEKLVHLVGFIINKSNGLSSTTQLDDFYKIISLPFCFVIHLRKSRVRQRVSQPQKTTNKTTHTHTQDPAIFRTISTQWGRNAHSYLRGSNDHTTLCQQSRST
jgi:hypothetical protein